MKCEAYFKILHFQFTSEKFTVAYCPAFFMAALETQELEWHGTRSMFGVGDENNLYPRQLLCLTCGMEQLIGVMVASCCY